MIKIGNVNIYGYASLSPMASVGDYAFRRICRENGACYTVGEMASAKGLLYESEKTKDLLTVHSDEHPGAVQLFGDDPAALASAAESAAEYGADILDINMGCPVPKVAGTGSGCALMKDIKKAEAIIKAVVAVSPVPVSVKFRAGWDRESINAVEFARMAESAGAAAITVHCRTREEMYSFPVDISVIGKVKSAVKIPVIGNGGVDDAISCERMYKETGCDLVAIGNGALGNPFVFREINGYFENGVIIKPTFEEKTDALLLQARYAIEEKGESRAIREIRKHAMWYFSGMKNASALKREAGYIKTYSELSAVCEKAKSFQM